MVSTNVTTGQVSRSTNPSPMRRSSTNPMPMRPMTEEERQALAKELLALLVFLAIVIGGLYLLFRPSSAGSGQGQISSYGEACSETVGCDQQAWLNCFNGACGCFKPELMLYDPKMGKCALKAAERCVFNSKAPNSKVIHLCPTCISNSRYNLDGYCICTDEFYEDSNGTCSTKGKYAQKCDDNSPCLASIGLTCEEGSCLCKPHSEYSAILNQCVGLAGRACVSNECTTYAICNDNGICDCRGDYFGNSDDKCVAKIDFGGNCTMNNQCIQGKGKDLKCMGGKCSCNPANSLFGTARRHWGECFKRSFYRFDESSSSTQCLGIEGSPCINGYCAPGTYCKYHDSCDYRIYGYTGTCRCLPGNSRSQLGTCGLPYGSACGSSAPCMDGLACSGNCSCRYDSQTYDSTTGKCTSPVGGPCNELSGCTDGAECVNIDNGRVEGRCQCKGLFIEAAGGTCHLGFGMNCNSTSTCDALTGLGCIEGTCQCKDFQRYSEDRQQCLGLVGAKCSIIVEDHNQCVENAICLKSRGEIDAGRCACTEGFLINGNYTCDEVGSWTWALSANSISAASNESARLL